MSDDKGKLLDEIAVTRGQAPAQRSERFGSDPNEEDRMGIAGEAAFATAFGYLVDRVPRPHGDGGVDFKARINGREIRIDVKTTKYAPYCLLLKKADVNRCAEILVLCQYYHGHVSLLGWETKGIMTLMPVREFREGSGLFSHFRMREELRPMSQLVNLLAMRDL